MRRESSLNISERIPKLKVQASLLLATQTPKPLTGRGEGKKNPDLFATNYFPAHRHNKGITKPYELLRPAKQAAPPAPASAASNATADVRPDHDWTRSLEQIDNSPKRGLNPESSRLPLNESTLLCPNMPEGPDSDTQAGTPRSDSSFVEVFSSSESWESTPQRRMQRRGLTLARRRTSGTPARRPRERADANSGTTTPALLLRAPYIRIGQHAPHSFAWL